MSRTVRSFVAVEVTAEIRTRTQKLIQRLQSVPAKVKWVEPENLHLTLKFLGDVEIEQTAAICTALRRAVATLEPFEVELAGVGAFPDVRRPRTVWIGVTRGEEALITLHGTLEDELAELGFRPENRRFRGHLTCGRVRSLARDNGQLATRLEENKDFYGGILIVDEILLISSELNADGPRYYPLGRAVLGEKTD